MLFCVSSVTKNHFEPEGMCCIVEADTFVGAVEKAAGLGLTAETTEVAMLQLPANEADMMFRHREKWEGKAINAFEMLTLVQSIKVLEGGSDEDTEETN